MNIHLRVRNGNARLIQRAFAAVQHTESDRPVIRRFDPHPDGEIQAVCDRIIIINHGIIAAHDTTENLSRSISADHRLIARIEGPRDEIVRAIRNLDGIKYVRAEMEREPGVYEYEIEAVQDQDIRRALFDAVAENHWYLLGLRSAELTLEDVFLKITMGEGIVVPSADEAKKEANA